MTFKKSLIASLLVGTIYAGSASAGMTCEYIHAGKSICEALTSNNQNLNSYQWSLSGSGSFSGGTSSPFASPICNMNTCDVQVIVTYPDGNTTTSSATIPSSTYYFMPPNGTGTGGTLPTGIPGCIGTHICN